MTERVTLENFDRAESDRYFSAVVRHGAFGRLEHERMVTPIEQQAVPRSNRDTLYSSGVFDLDAAALAITLPDPGSRFMSLVVVDERSYTHVEIHEPGLHTFTRAGLGTRYALVEVRFFVDAHDPSDIDAVHALQDAIAVRQHSAGRFEVPAWDDASETFVRSALLALRETLGAPAEGCGSRFEIDPIRHLVGCAATGGSSDRAALSIAVTPEANDGTTVHHLTVHHVPVDGLWSISVYNGAGFFERNDRDAYTVNSVTAARNTDGSITVQLGGCDPDVPNCLPIAPGWSYVVRLYRPRAEILDGEFQFPVAVPVTTTFQEAVELVRWGMPLVASAAMRHAYVRDAGARDNDIVYWSRRPDHATQLPTIHGAARYVLAMFETFHGPVVLEVPPAGDGMLVGSILDAWQQPVADIGAEGGRFLLRPPTDATDDRIELPDAIPIELCTFGGYVLLRAVPELSIEMLHELRLTPLDDHHAVTEPRLIDMTGKPFDGLVKFDERFFDELARVVAVEPVPERDHHRLATVGRVAHAASTLLIDAARVAHEALVRRVSEHGARVWPSRHWRRLSDVESHQAEESVARDLVAFRHVAPAARSAGPGAWLHAFVDAHGDPLRCDRSYRLRIPAYTPAWTITAYDRSTCAFIRDATAIEIRSDDPELVVDADGTVELDFGSRSRTGREANFIDTARRGPWFVTFHVERELPDGWELPDVDAVH